MLHVWFYGCEVIRCTSLSDSWIHLDPRGGGERGEGMCVCAWVRAQRNPRHAAQGVKRGRQALLHSARGGKAPWQQQPAVGALGRHCQNDHDSWYHTLVTRRDA